MYFHVNVPPAKPLDVATSNVLCVTLTPQGQGQIMYFLVNASPAKPFDVATSNFAGA